VPVASRPALELIDGGGFTLAQASASASGSWCSRAARRGQQTHARRRPPRHPRAHHLQEAGDPARPDRPGIAARSVMPAGQRRRGSGPGDRSGAARPSLKSPRRATPAGRFMLSITPCRKTISDRLPCRLLRRARAAHRVFEVACPPIALLPRRAARGAPPATSSARARALAAAPAGRRPICCRPITPRFAASGGSTSRSAPTAIRRGAPSSPRSPATRGRRGCRSRRLHRADARPLAAARQTRAHSRYGAAPRRR